MVAVSTLKPGLLVSLKTSVIGNAEYRRLEIEPDHLTDQGSRRARWETERVIADPDERERAIKTRTQCVVAVRRVCAASMFGLLCPEDQRGALDDAIRTAVRLTTEFNESAALTRVRVYVIVGRIAANDAEAVRAINSEVRSLIDDMSAGIDKLDARAVRDAASKAQSLGRMMEPAAAGRIKEAVAAAREAAKKIIKAGESAGVAIDGAVIRRIAESRTAFLDIGDDPIDVAAPLTVIRAIDLEPVQENMEACDAL